MAIEPAKDIARIFQEGTLIEEALNAAVREAVLRHKQMGLPLVVWRDGKTVLIPPGEIDTEASRPKSESSGVVNRPSEAV